MAKIDESVRIPAPVPKPSIKDSFNKGIKQQKVNFTKPVVNNRRSGKK